MAQPKLDVDDIVPGKEPPWVFELAAIRRACSPRRDEITQSLAPHQFETLVRKDAWRLATQDGQLNEAQLFVKLCSLKHDNEMAYKTAFGDEIIAMVEENYPTDAIIRKVINGAAERLKRDVAARLGSGSITPAQAVSELEGLVETILGDPGSERSTLAGSRMTLEQSLATPEASVRLFLQGGGFPLGYYSIVHGHGGLGKTRIMCDFVIRQLLGEKWLGWTPTDEPFIPLVLSLEMTRPAMTEVLRVMAYNLVGPQGFSGIASQCHIIGSPEFTGTLYGDDPGTEEQLVREIRDCGATFVVIDSLGKTNRTGVDSQEGLGPSIALLDRVATLTSASVVAIHHDRKIPAGAPKPDEAAASARGPSNLIDGCRFALNVDKHAGRNRVRFHKITFGPETPPAYFELDTNGCPKQLDAPKAVAEANRQVVLEALRKVERPDAPASRADVVAVVKLSNNDMTDRTVKRHLASLISDGFVVATGSNKDTRYSIHRDTYTTGTM